MSFIDEIKLQDIRADVRELQSGRPNITGLPTFRSGINFENTSGSAITFYDGTTQNTAPSAGTVYTYVEIASAAVSAVTTYTFDSSVVTSSTAYRLEYILVQNTSAGDFRVQVNGVAAAYRWVVRQDCDSTAAAQNVSTSDSAIQTNINTFEMFPARGFMGSLDFTQTEYPTGRVLVLSRNSVADNTVICENHGTGTLATLPPLSSFTVTTSAGTFTGVLKLYKRIDR